MTQMTYRHPSPPLVPRRTKRTKNRWDLQWLGKWQTVPSIWSGEISREVCDTVCIRCCSTCFFEYCSYGGILCIHYYIVILFIYNRITLYINKYIYIYTLHTSKKCVNLLRGCQAIIGLCRHFVQQIGDWFWPGRVCTIPQHVAIQAASIDWFRLLSPNCLVENIKQYIHRMHWRSSLHNILYNMIHTHK